MNPLQKLNAKLQAKEKVVQRRIRVRKCKLAALSLCFTLIGIALCVHYQIAPKATVVEVAVNDVDEPSAAQTLEVRPHSTNFQAGLNRLHIVTLSYAEADASPQAELPKVRLASRSADFVPTVKRELPKAAVKPAPKPRVALAPARVQVSSDNWAQLTKFQKWNFVAAYLKSKHWVCPASGMTKTQEMDELNKYSWTTIERFGFTNCSTQS